MGYKMSGPSLYPNIKRSSHGYRIGHTPSEFKIIPSNKISMKEENGDPLEKGNIKGTGLTTGNTKIMKPGEEHTFVGDKEVLETPLAKKEGTQYIDGVLCDAYGQPINPNTYDAYKSKDPVFKQRLPTENTVPPAGTSKVKTNENNDKYVTTTKNEIFIIPKEMYYLINEKGDFKAGDYLQSQTDSIVGNVNYKHLASDYHNTITTNKSGTKKR